ncbi:MAG: hypothetical protein Q9O62_05725 [Ardenticatenia bacterium]|nr:hypothetical protein [Ardenticatenia bacterium]
MNEELAVVEAHTRLLSALMRLRRRLRRRDALEALVRWWWPMALVALLVQVIAWLWPVEHASLYSALALGTGLAGWALWALVRPLSLRHVALRADVEGALKERLITAFELLSSSNNVANVVRRQQLHDAVRAAETAAHNAHLIFPQRLDTRRMALWAGLLALTLALGMLPNPQRQVLAERRAVRELAQQEAQRIEQVRAELAGREGLLPSQERAELVQELAKLAERLRQNPGDRERALADIERARQALRARLDPQAGTRQAALARLAERLGRMSQDQKRATSPREAADALQALATQAATASPPERAQVASDLRHEARQVAATDPELAGALMALADAIEASNLERAQMAAQAGADALRAAGRELALQQDVARALDALDNARANMAQGGNNAVANRPGGQGDAHSNQPGPSQGDQAAGNRLGTGTGTGRPGRGGGTQADRLPPSTGGGPAGPMPRDGSGPGALVDTYEPRVFAPMGRQPSEDVDTIRGEPSPGGRERTLDLSSPDVGLPSDALVPLSQVWPQYRSASAKALDRAYIPGGLKAYVRDYFASLDN